MELPNSFLLLVFIMFRSLLWEDSSSFSFTSQIIFQYNSLLFPIKKNKKYDAKDNRVFAELVFNDGFLFNKVRLCIFKGSLRELLIGELYAGGLGGYFGRNGTLNLVSEK